MSGMQTDSMGWPYFNDDGDVVALPAYTRALRDKLHDPVSGAAQTANDVTTAQAAATQAQQAATAAQQSVTDAQAAASSVPHTAAGSATVTLGGATSTTTAVTFPAGRFTAAPSVALNVNAVTVSGGQIIARAINVTSSGFTVYAFRADGTALPASGSVTVNWLAVAPS